MGIFLNWMVYLGQTSKGMHVQDCWELLSTRNLLVGKSMISEGGFGWDLLSIINTNCGNLLVGKSLISEVVFWNIKTCCLPPTTQRTVRAQNHEDP